MDAGGRAVLVGAIWVCGDSRWVGLVVNRLAKLDSMQASLGEASLSSGPGVQGPSW
jgi:hypothetical protein